jgi:hypothetical protein
MERMWWADGLEQYEDALRLDPSYRFDEGLIENVVRSLINDRVYPGNESLLVDRIGSPALPALQRSARSNPNAKVRERARALVERLSPAPTPAAR